MYVEFSGKGASARVYVQNLVDKIETNEGGMAAVQINFVSTTLSNPGLTKSTLFILILRIWHFRAE